MPESMTEDSSGDGAEARPAEAEPGRTKPRWRGFVRHGGRVLLGLALGIVVTEVVFRWRDGGAFPHLNFYVEDAERGVRLRPGATERIRFSNNPISSVRINAEGYRGADWPPPGADEVVTVGDSQVFGLGVEEGETFSAVLQSALGGKRLVRNLGVPTYGPREYNAALEEALAKRPATLVVYTVNIANDLFEANRPNRDRHAVWDGWAVRKETAPSSVTSFPGRSFLYSQSHAFYALRRWMYDRGPKVDEGGFASEGTWRDIGEAATLAGRERSAAEEETARLERIHQREIEYAKDGVTAADQAVEDKLLYASPLLRDGDFDYDKGGLPKEAIYRAAKLSPGDIVTTHNAESSRDARVNAEEIRRGALLRIAVEKEARRQAELSRDKETLGLFARRDELEKKVATLQAAVPAKVEALSPLAPALREAKAICDKHGARLFVVALPIDVQVSSAEWAKYGAKPVDMEPSKVLLADIVVAARSVGADGLDATAALSAAEPGAFLDGDIHMTPKGHKALGEAIAKAIVTPHFDVPRAGLPPARSRAPRPEEWTPSTEIAVRESDPAGCETKKVREWLGIFCRHKGGAKGVIVSKGSEVVAGSVPGASVLIAPVIRGQSVKATFVFEGTTREFTVDVPDAPEGAVIGFDKPALGTPALPPKNPHTDALCTCFAAKFPGQSCAKAATTVADADCATTYASDCEKLIACSSGDPAAPPKCREGSAAAGAFGRCHALCSAEVGCTAGKCTEWQGGRVCM